RCTSSTFAGQPGTSTGSAHPPQRTDCTPQTAPARLTATPSSSVLRSWSPPLHTHGLMLPNDTAHAQQTSPVTNGRQPTSSPTAAASQTATSTHGRGAAG